MSSPLIYQHRLKMNAFPLPRHRRTTRYDTPTPSRGPTLEYSWPPRSPPTSRSTPTVATCNDETSIQSGYTSQSNLSTMKNCTPPRIRNRKFECGNSPRSTIVPDQVSQPLLCVSADCPICMEKLTSVTNQAIGVTVPCGHCFHWDCYQKWKNRSNICPTCRECTSDFIQIFISAEINEASVKDVDKEVVDQLRKCINKNKNLQQEMEELKKEMVKLNTNSNVKEYGENLYKIWRGLQYMWTSAMRGCRRPNEDRDSHNHNNLIFEPINIRRADTFDSEFSWDDDNSLSN
jgi:hypothetical protein